MVNHFYNHIGVNVTVPLNVARQVVHGEVYIQVSQNYILKYVKYAVNHSQRIPAELACAPMNAERNRDAFLYQNVKKGHAMASLLDIIRKDSHLRLISNTHGGEYAGPCPFCGGKDRLRVWPVSGKWTCRQCQNFQPRDIKDYLHLKGNLSPDDIEKIQASLELSEAVTINRELWSQGAFNLINRAREWLWTASDIDIRLSYFLTERGIRSETVLVNNIGFIATDKKFNLSFLGLPDKIGTLKAGYTIPYFYKGDVVGVKIKTLVAPPKYSYLAGSSGVHPYFPTPLNTSTDTLIIVEGELDAIVLAQDVTSVQVASFGSAGCKWNDFFEEAIKDYSRIFIIPDNDKAGLEHANYLKRYIPTMTIIQHSRYKDVTDMKVQGNINLTRFLMEVIGGNPI